MSILETLSTYFHKIKDFVFLELKIPPKPIPTWRRWIQKGSFDSILTIGLIMVIIIRLCLFLVSREGTFPKFNPAAYQRAYGGSVYSQKGGAPIADHIVLGYAAWEYINGKNPVLINPEMPPLGKYLMGLSIILFHRVAIGSLFFGLNCLILVFLIAKKILGSCWLALIPIILLLNEPLFTGQLTVALLETYHLFFILLSFWFFILAQKRPVFYPFSILALGGVMATKFFITSFVIGFSWGAYLFFKKDWKNIAKLVVFSPLAVIVLALSYFKIFIDGESLRRFFGIQKWIWEFHSSGKFLVPYGSVWQLIFLRKWVTWWGDRQPLPAPDWQITWPLSIIVSLIFGVIGVIGKKLKLQEATKIILIWVVIYLASLSFGITYPRYLLPLLPFIFILTIRALEIMFSGGIKWDQQR